MARAVPSRWEVDPLTTYMHPTEQEGL